MSAIISDCGTYRYELTRPTFRDGPIVSVFMVNPSTADWAVNDATIRKLLGFGKRLGWGELIVGNIFAFRATDINALRTATDPVGPLNHGHLLSIMLRSQMSIVAWGTLGKLPKELRDEWRVVANMARALNRKLLCWGTCNDGHPRHPVMIGYDNELIHWDMAA